MDPAATSTLDLPAPAPWVPYGPAKRPPRRQAGDPNAPRREPRPERGSRRDRVRRAVAESLGQ